MSCQLDSCKFKTLLLEAMIEIHADPECHELVSERLRLKQADRQSETLVTWVPWPPSHRFWEGALSMFSF